MSKVLRLADNLSLPIEAVTKKFGFFGQNGSGKTYGAMKLAELMLGAGGQIVVIDPVGKWYGLRLAANGKDPSGIEIPVFGGLHGDIPLESAAGELVADVIVDRGISAVLDVSQFDYDAERARFMEHLARQLFNRKKAAPSAIHIFIEEAQEFLPMQPNKGEEKMLREMLRWGKIGRNHGFGWSLITPRPQEITTKARNLSEVVLAFQTNGTHERKAIAEWVKEKGEDTDVVELLPKLKPGFAHAWSPSWLEFSGTVHINKKETFDASATPLVGAKAVEAKPLGSIDLAQLQKAMAATIEKRKAEDPAELKKQLATATGRIRQLEKGAGVKTIEKPVVDQAAIHKAVTREVAASVSRERKLLKPLLDRLQRIAGVISSMPATVEELTRIVDRPFVPAVAAPDIPIDGEPPRRIEKADPPPRVRRPDIAPSNGDLSGPEQKILDVLASFEAMGITAVPANNVAAFVGYHPNAKSYSNAKGSLRSRGYIDYGTGTISLTEGGRQHARVSVDISDLESLHNAWFERLPGPGRKILEEVIPLWKESIDRDDLAAKVGYHPNAKSYSNALGTLRSLGLIDYPVPRRIAATDMLFPEGLA